MTFETVCIECGEEFDAKTLFARYCGARCRMRAYRKTEKGMAMVKKVNERYKRPDVDKECMHCGKGFTTTKSSRQLCDDCIEQNRGAYYAQKRYRAKNRI